MPGYCNRLVRSLTYATNNDTIQANELYAAVTSVASAVVIAPVLEVASSRNSFALSVRGFFNRPTNKKKNKCKQNFLVHTKPILMNYIHTLPLKVRQTQNPMKIVYLNALKKAKIHLNGDRYLTGYHTISYMNNMKFICVLSRTHLKRWIFHFSI